MRDRERQGALIHYSSSQATEMTYHPQQMEPPSRQPNPRAEHVKTVGSGRGRVMSVHPYFENKLNCLICMPVEKFRKT